MRTDLGSGDARGPLAVAAAALDAALRHLVHAARAERRPLPVCVLADVHGGGARVELGLTAPSGDPPRGWRGGGASWWCDVAALGDVGAAPAAYPGFVPVGRSAADTSVVSFVDLGAAPGLVTVEGPARETTHLLTALTDDLRRMPWATSVQVWRAPDLDAVRDTTGHAVGETTDEGAGGAPPSSVLHPPPVLGGLDGRWGRAPRGRHDVVVLTEPSTTRLRGRVRAAARRRDAATVLAPVAPGDFEARGAWNWCLDGEVLTW